MRSALSRDVGVSLCELFPKSRFLGGGPFTVQSCCDRAHHCQPGDLYAAVQRPHYDGHDDIELALARGATAVLAERPVAVSVPTCLVADSRSAFSVLCQALAGNPTRDLQTIGISGTHGKTITSVLLSAILEAAGFGVGIWNSLGRCDGQHVQPPGPSLAAPPELAKWLASFVRQGCSHAVVETSSANLATRTMDGVELDVALLTNVRRANLELHGSVQNYRAAEHRLLKLLKPTGIVALNIDDPGSQASFAELKHPAITFGWDSQADVHATLLESSSQEQVFLLHVHDECIPVSTRLFGLVNVTNCLAAAAAATALGVDLDVIARGLETVRSIPGRMERIPHRGDIPIFFDQVTTPDGMATMLQSLRKLARRRLVCVLGVPAESLAADRAVYGRTLERMADTGIITATAHGQRLALELAHDVLDGYDRPALAHLIPDRTKAIRWALEKSQSGDVLYFLGRNYEQPNANYVGGNDGSVAEDDREVVSATVGQVRRHTALRFAA